MSNFPGSLDDNTSLPNPGGTDNTLNSNPLLLHHYQHDTANDAIKAIEAKLGTTASLPGGAYQMLISSTNGASYWGNLPVGGDLTGSLPNPVLASSGVSSGTYGSGTQIPVITVDGKGRITSVSNVNVVGGGGGGSSSPLTTKGDIWVYSTADTRLPVGTNGWVLSADSTQATGLRWVAQSGGITGPGTTVSGNIVTWNSTNGTVVADGGLSLPGSAFVGTTDAQTLTNKIFDGSSTMTPQTNGFTLLESTDNTKRVIFSASPITTATTRTFTFPNVNGTFLTTGNVVTVGQGGTGRATGTTAYGIVAVGTTATGAQQTISPGTSGMFLKSGGSAALAAFANITEADIANLVSDLAAKAPLASPQFTTAVGINTAANSAIGLTIDPGADANKGIVIFNHSATQSGNLLELQSNTFSPLFSVSSAGHLLIEGVTSTGATGTGKVVFATSPVLTTATVAADPVASLGVASKQYVDNLGTTTLVQGETPTGLVNGSNVSYATASTFATGSLRVYLNGQRLTAGSGNDYVEGTQAFTMQYAPATGDVLLVDYNVSNTAFIQGSNSQIVNEIPTGTVNGSTTLFTVLRSKYVANTLEVFLNGVQQLRNTDYTETSPGSGTFTFTTAPATGQALRVSYQFSTGSSGNADTVDGYHASATPTASTIPVLDSSALLPRIALPATYQMYASTTTGFSTTSTSDVQVTGLSLSYTPPTGVTRVKVTVQAFAMSNNTASTGVYLSLYNGTIGSGGVQFAGTNQSIPSANFGYSAILIGVQSVTAGTPYTFNAAFHVNSGTGTLQAATNTPASILLEAIG